jgi:hypothetical protein
LTQSASCGEWSYDIELASGLRRLAVNACFAGTPPRALVPAVPEARRLVNRIDLYRDGRTIPMRLQRGAIDGASLRTGDCVRYDVDITLALGDSDGLLGARLVGQDLLLSPDLWLWQPEPVGDLPRIVARFSLPPGIGVAAPWPREHDGFVIPESQWTMRSQVAFGGFSTVDVAASSLGLEVSYLGSGWHDRRPSESWLDEAARAAILLRDRGPTSPIQVVVAPDPDRDLSFGFALRGGGSTVVLLANPTHTEADLRSDWTATHELLHLGFPATAAEDAWLAEGFATYYQEILRARVGIVSPEEAWAALVAGFSRGQGAKSQATLRAESRDMHETHRYWPVYWSGAALMLTADVALRRTGRTLDEGVRSLARCCLEGSRIYPADELVARLDKYYGAPIVSHVVGKHLDSSTFPPTRPTLEALGVLPVPDSPGVTLDELAPLAAMRREIEARTLPQGAGPSVAGAGR